MSDLTQLPVSQASRGTRPFLDSAPFIVRWSGEVRLPGQVVVRRHRIGYADERSYDRDEHGVLWARTPSQRGRGRPLFGKVHALRQRMCMHALRCQVCGGPADRTAQGVLWLIPGRPDELKEPYEVTSEPPVCEPCAARAARECPALRRGASLLRVRNVIPYGVTGILYRKTPGGPEALTRATLPFDDPRIYWMTANHLHVTLADFVLLGSPP